MASLVGQRDCLVWLASRHHWWQYLDSYPGHREPASVGALLERLDYLQHLGVKIQCFDIR